MLGPNPQYESCPTRAFGVFGVLKVEELSKWSLIDCDNISKCECST